MPKYIYHLTEKTTVVQVIEAETIEEAEQKIEDICDQGIDWGMGKMDNQILFMGKEND